MLSTWKEKFTWKQFSLTEEEPEVFITSQWQSSTNSSIIYLIYRWILATYFFATWLFSILSVKKKTDGYQAKWLIYLTNWGYTICTFQAFLAAIMLSAYALSDRRKSFAFIREKCLGLYKLYWLTNGTGTVVACGITIIYWSFIYNPKKNDLDVMNFFMHAMNSVLMTFDFWIVSHPVRLAHSIYPIGLALIYAIFSVIYYLAGGTSREDKNYIYPILRWEMPFKTIIVCLGVGVFFFLLQVFYYIQYLLKKKLHKKLGRRNSVELTCTITELKNEEAYDNEAVIINDQV